MIKHQTAACAASLRDIGALPGPRGLPLIGNALQVKSSRFHLQLEAWSARFGPYFKLQMGRRRLLVVADHSVIGAMLRDRPDGFRRTTHLERIASELGMARGLFIAEGDEWRRQRLMVMAGFDPGHVKRYFPSLHQVGARLLVRWQKAAAARRPIDVQGDLMRYTVDTIAGLAFGTEVNTLDSTDDVIQRHLDVIFPNLWQRLLAPVPTWRIVRTPADRRLEGHIAEVDKAIAGFIASARARLRQEPALRDNPSNLLEAMIVAADRDHSGIDDRHVKGNVLTLLLAGEDTTANSIAWMIQLLWSNPAALARAREEVRSVAGAGIAVTPEQMGQLPYLEACIQETMRLKPVAPVIFFQAIRDTTIGDIRVPAGTTVAAVMRKDSLDPQLVPDAASFVPERWLAGDGAAPANPAKHTSMPFGGGARICPGRYLALLEIKMAMTVLLAHFDIEQVGTANGAEADERLAFTMAPAGLQMRLRER